MTKIRLAHFGLALAALGFTAATPLVGLAPMAYAAETLRPEIGKPIQAAQALMKSGKNKEALAKLREADAVGGKSAAESYLIERVRAGAASAAGDYNQAAKSFEILLDSGRLSASEKAQFSEGLVGIYMRAKDYGKANAAIERQLKERNDPKLRGYLMQNYYNMGNTAAVLNIVRGEEKAGRVPSEDMYGMVANLQNKAGDKAGYVATLEKLARHYPNANTWNDLLNRVQRQPGFSQRLAVDIYRLKLKNNLLKKPSEFMEMAQLVLQEKSPAEAQRVVAAGYKAGALGVGAEAPRHQRLKDLADREAASFVGAAPALEAAIRKENDMSSLARLGYGLVQSGKTEQGLKLMNEAIKSGQLGERKEEVELRLGQAYAYAGNQKQALATWKGVDGKDGSAALARYFAMAK
ncbi:tetratricopeptide repeat protein [Pseudoduganella sp. GCM10020061]|jgi:hypothetical protein|uniref:tetratricopeptide repeat protein n=1 Tax=Pseudoduganella sp. GCM10020061 TaxID=3317345 RepID=UPI00362B20F4